MGKLKFWTVKVQDCTNTECKIIDWKIADRNYVEKNIDYHTTLTSFDK